MPLDDVQGFVIESTLELPADEFRAQMMTAATFLGATPNETAMLTIGVDGNQVTALDGVIDRYILVIENEKVLSAASGRDNASKLLDRRFKKLYTMGIPQTDPGIPFIVGTFKASFVAKEAIESTGLQLSWQCPDYDLKEDFIAQERIVDTLRRLIEPWVVTDRFKTDIFVRGTLVTIRQRPDTFVAEETFAVASLRSHRITVEKERLPLIGKITILGELHDPQSEDGFGGLSILNVGTIERVTLEQTFNPNGSLKSVEARTQTVLIPEETVIAEEIEMKAMDGVGLKTVKKEFVEMDLNAGVYDAAGRRLNQVVKHRERRIIHALPIDKVGQPDFGETLELFEQVQIDLKYDADGLEVLNDKTLSRVTGGALKPVERLIRRLDDTSPGLVKEITDTYEVDEKTGTLFLKTTRVVENQGQRPGFLLNSQAVSTTQVGRRAVPRKLEEVVSTDPTAQDVQVSNPHLDLVLMQKVLDQIKATSGIWQTEIRIEQVAMPWISKGVILLITGLLDADGNAVTLQPALVVKQEFTYNEASDPPSSLSTMTAVYWSASP